MIGNARPRWRGPGSPCAAGALLVCLALAAPALAAAPPASGTPGLPVEALPRVDLDAAPPPGGAVTLGLADDTLRWRGAPVKRLARTLAREAAVPEPVTLAIAADAEDWQAPLETLAGAGVRSVEILLRGTGNGVGALPVRLATPDAPSEPPREEAPERRPYRPCKDPNDGGAGVTLRLLAEGGAFAQSVRGGLSPAALLGACPERRCASDEAARPLLEALATDGRKGDEPPTLWLWADEGVPWQRVTAMVAAARRAASDPALRPADPPAAPLPQPLRVLLGPGPVRVCGVFQVLMTTGAGGDWGPPAAIGLGNLGPGSGRAPSSIPIGPLRVEHPTVVLPPELRPQRRAILACHARARLRDPELDGVRWAVRLQVDEAGRVTDVAFGEPGPQPHEDELADCIRQTMRRAALPAAADGKPREVAFELELPPASRDDR